MLNAFIIENTKLFHEVATVEQGFNAALIHNKTQFIIQLAITSDNVLAVDAGWWKNTFNILQMIDSDNVMY